VANDTLFVPSACEQRGPLAIQQVPQDEDMFARGAAAADKNGQEECTDVTKYGSRKI